jgi:hypothetical protein
MSDLPWQPADLVPNARPWRGAEQSLHIKYFVNDAIPRRVTFTVDLGPDQVTSDPVGLSTSDLYGREVTVALKPT